jgi:hypothetical protein
VLTSISLLLFAGEVKKEDEPKVDISKPSFPAMKKSFVTIVGKMQAKHINGNAGILKLGDKTLRKLSEGDIIEKGDHLKLRCGCLGDT